MMPTFKNFQNSVAYAEQNFSIQRVIYCLRLTFQLNIRCKLQTILCKQCEKCLQTVQNGVQCRGHTTRKKICIL